MNVREIAKLANVSIATVSRVINRPEVVLPETREQVLAVMRKYGYNPPLHAGAPAQPKTVGLIVPDAEDYLSVRLMMGVESVAARRDYTVCLCGTKGAGREGRLIASALELRMHGLVIQSNTLSEQEVQELKRRRVPFVLVGRGEAAPQYNACYINYEEGAYRMARHLLELGHQRFLLLCGANAPNIEERMWEGLCRARRELLTGPGEGDRVLRIEGASIRAGYEAAGEVLAGGRPDAVFASSDELALGLMKALKENGTAVPGEIAVTGFTDSPAAGVVTPELTTVEQPTHRLGMVAARMLFDLIDDESLIDGTPQEIVLMPKLKIRNSCGNRRPINTTFE